MKSFFGGKKSHEPPPKSITVNRSDDAGQDLNAILASTDIAGIMSNVNSSPPEKPKADTHEDDHGMIALTRSDGVNHCIINVFKGVSDAKGDTMMRTSLSGAGYTESSSSRISLSKALSSSAIANLRGNIPLSVRIVHMSDTANFLTASNPTTFVPKGDILVHSGNFTVYGAKKEFEQFNAWLGTVANDFKYRIVTLGCRDVKEFGNNWDVMRSLLANATHVLCHESAVVLGIRFYACPWHWGHHKNYVVRKGAPASTSGRFDEIPEDTQVLITHGAAAGVLDTSNLPGSKELTEGIRRAKPALHLHGHSKGAHGVVPAFAKYPLVVNSSLCDADARVMYACAHVIKAAQIGATESTAASGTGNWNFAMDSLM